MYQYTAFDTAFVQQRAAQFRDQRLLPVRDGAARAAQVAGVRAGTQHVGQGQGVLDALEHLARLRLDAANNDLALVVGGHLARDKNEVACAGGGREGACEAIGRERRLAEGFYWHGKRSFE